MSAQGNGRVTASLSNKRSKLFTETYSYVKNSSLKNIKYYNKQGKVIYLDKTKKQIARDFLCSGKVKILIPTYEEHQFGAVYDVLDYFDQLVGKKNILVIDADSKDRTGAHVKKLGFTSIEQHDIEQCLDLKKIAHDFCVELPLRKGKGKTLLLTNILLHHINQSQNIEFNLFSDADIRNPKKFNHAMYLAWVASLYSPGKLLEIKVAQPNRNNQSVMNGMSALQGQNPVIHEYYSVLREMVWPLTGQTMRSTRFMNYIPNTLGYSTEMVTNFASVDFRKKWQMEMAQIQIATRCLDYENDLSKEAAMMVGISSTVCALNEVIFKNNIPISQMKKNHYQLLNKYLHDIENYDKEGFLVSVINSANKPNNILRIKLDRILPPANFLYRKGYVDVPKIKKLGNVLLENNS